MLSTIDQGIQVANQVIGLQEYGKANPSLVAGLEARGAQVLSVPVYKWGLPARSLAPLEENVRAIAGWPTICVVVYVRAASRQHARLLQMS